MPGDLYFGLYRTPAMPVYNSRLVAAADAPREWDDLLDPRWKGKVLIRDPLASGTMRAVWSFILSKSVLETGSAGRGLRVARPARRADEGIRLQPDSDVREARAGRGTRDDLGPARHAARTPARLAPSVRLPEERHARHRRCDRSRRRGPASRPREAVHRFRRREIHAEPRGREDVPPAGSHGSRRGSSALGSRGRSPDGPRPHRLGSRRPRSLRLDDHLGPDDSRQGEPRPRGEPGTPAAALPSGPPVSRFRTAPAGGLRAACRDGPRLRARSRR